MPCSIDKESVESFFLVTGRLVLSFKVNYVAVFDKCKRISVNSISDLIQIAPYKI